MDDARPKQYSISRQLYEVYKTDEENFEPYVPNSGETEDTTTDEEDTTGEEEEDDSSTEEEDDDDDEGFTLHQGEIIETYYYDYFNEIGFENDYEDISDTGSLKIPEIIDLDRFYKGVRTRLCKTWEEPGTTTNAEEIPEVFKGFITEETFSESGMELKLSGMTKLLEAEYQFSFTQMLRSKIIEEVIKTAGMIPVVDPEGLDDQVIDYTNVSSSDSDDDSSVDNSNLPADACKFAKQLTKGKKGDRAKAEAIYNWINSNFPYYGYSNSHYNEQNIYATAKANIGKAIFNCCDHAHLSVVLLRCAGLKANYIHVYNHVYTVVYINGSRVMFDPLGYSRGMGTVASGYATDGTELESISF